jgi:hypothetical protein
MSAALASATATLAGPAETLSTEALDYARTAAAANTRRTYRAAWQDFEG